jgi:DNA-binding CsgD family transcriptional regulator
MAGFTLDDRQTSLIAEIADACSTPDGDPVPWQALRLLRALLNADDVEFGGFDTLLPHIWIHQTLGPDGGDLDIETPWEATENPYWANYWQGPCSYPDRTGDFTSVTTLSDSTSLPEARARARANGHGLDRSIRACVPGRAPGRHLRMLGWRAGADFSEQDRFFLTLLRPHFAQAYRSAAAQHRPAPSLTRRQLQVLRMVMDGYTNLQIAHRLHLSEGTVRTHLNNIYERLDVTSRIAAVQRVFGVGDAWF